MALDMIPTTHSTSTSTYRTLEEARFDAEETLKVNKQIKIIKVKKLEAYYERKKLEVEVEDRLSGE